MEPSGRSPWQPVAGLGDAYRTNASHTGRFLPRVRRARRPTGAGSTTNRIVVKTPTSACPGAQHQRDSGEAKRRSRPVPTLGIPGPRCDSWFWSSEDPKPGTIYKDVVTCARRDAYGRRII